MHSSEIIILIIILLLLLIILIYYMYSIISIYTEREKIPDAILLVRVDSVACLCVGRVDLLQP